jgi:hypothetical protein
VTNCQGFYAPGVYKVNTFLYEMPFGAYNRLVIDFRLHCCCRQILLCVTNGLRFSGVDDINLPVDRKGVGVGIRRLQQGSAVDGIAV